MAEAEQSDKNAPAPHRRPYHPNRPNYSYRGRGRGRGNPSVNKALYLFGVRDLREILDRKHQEEEQATGGPPPDPSYNYLKDPSREFSDEHHSEKYHKEQHSERTLGDTQPRRSHSFRGSRGRGRGGAIPRENRHYEHEKPSFIQNPVNIKVELIASTGERNCKLDEETKIADIKCVPNYKLKDLRPSKNESNVWKDGTDTYRNERGRGRWQRGRRGRGRGERGRGRGQGRYSNRNNENTENNQSLQQTSPKAVSEENWDKECIDFPTQEIAPNINEKENDDTHEEDYVEDQEGPEIYYQQEGDEEEYSETNEGHHSLEEAAEKGDIKLEENLVITSSENEDKRKRMVTFKLGDNQSGEAASLGNDKEVVEKEPSQTDEGKKVEGTENAK